MVIPPKIYTSKSALPKGTHCVDELENAIRELFYIEHSRVQKNDTRGKEQMATFFAKADSVGVWAYYPWRHTAVHMPAEDTYFRLRTARNRNLVTEKEQRMYRDAVVAVAGLSVGSAVVATLTATGGPKRMKIADPDKVEITNLNRMRATALNLGMNKADVAAQGIWELDPFAELEIWDQGVGPGDIRKFLTNTSRLDVFVDEMDNIEMKVLSRQMCREEGIPVVMATDNGDSVIVDIERFDLEPERPIFHGRVQLSSDEMQSMDREKFVALSSKIIDPAHFTERQQSSIAEIGKSLSGVAQLGTAAALAGATVAYAVRLIATKSALPSGRYLLGCESTFVAR